MFGNPSYPQPNQWRKYSKPNIEHPLEIYEKFILWICKFFILKMGSELRGTLEFFFNFYFKIKNNCFYFDWVRGDKMQWVFVTQFSYSSDRTYENCSWMLIVIIVPPIRRKLLKLLLKICIIFTWTVLFVAPTPEPTTTFAGPGQIMSCVWNQFPS